MSKGNKSKIDKLGRVVIPKSIREALNISHEENCIFWKFNHQLG